MTTTNYADLVRPLKFRKGRGGANAREMVFMRGEELAGFEVNFIVGVYDTPGDWAPDRGAHAHPFDEVLLFFGYDPQNLDYLGSDINLSIGKEQEQHRFSTPTAVAMPAGMPHNPLVTEKVYKNFGHFHIALSANYAGTTIPKEGITDGHKYDRFFKPMVSQRSTEDTGAPFLSLNGDDLAGMKLNFKMCLYNREGTLQQAAHKHPYDEVLVFFGHKVEDLSYLGADVSLSLGPQGEVFNFNVPTAVAVPRGLEHFPLKINKLENPFRIMQIGLSEQYQTR